MLVPLLQLGQNPPGFAGELGLNIQGQGLLEGRLAFGFCFKLVLGHAEVVEEFAIVFAGLEALFQVLSRRGVVGATISHNPQDLCEIRVIGEGVAGFGGEIGRPGIVRKTVETEDGEVACGRNKQGV